MALEGRLFGPRSTKKDKLCEVILYTIRNGNRITTKEINNLANHNIHILEKLMETGLFIRVAQGLYSVDLEVLKQCAYIVPDDLYEKLGDREYVTTVVRGVSLKDRISRDKSAAKRIKDEKARKERGRQSRPPMEQGELTMRDILF